MKGKRVRENLRGLTSSARKLRHNFKKQDVMYRVKDW